MNLMYHLEGGWQTFIKYIGPALLSTFVFYVVAFLSFGLLAPVISAGYFHSLLRAHRDARTPEIKDLFSHMSLFLPLLLFGFLALCAVSLGFVIFVLPGFVAMLLLVFACLYLLPLMTDKNMGLVKGLENSWHMAMAKPVADHAVIAIVYVGLISIGGSLPFVILLAQPLATCIVVSFYEERLKVLGEIVSK